jgi:hypothetical protein
MNPGDVLMLLMSLALAGMVLFTHGWSLTGMALAVFALAGGLWNLWMQQLRHRVWLQHKDSEFVPGTQHLAISGWLGWSIATYTAMACIWLKLRELRP